MKKQPGFSEIVLKEKHLDFGRQVNSDSHICWLFPCGSWSHVPEWVDTSAPPEVKVKVMSKVINLKVLSIRENINQTCIY